MTLTILTVAHSGLAAGESRQFRAHLQGFAGPTPTSDPCVWTNTEAGTGTAVHLGAIVWGSSESVNFCDPAFVPDARVNGTLVLTAANGDELQTRYVTRAAFYNQLGRVTFMGTWEVTGGTGRFANASGSGVLSGSGNLLAPFDVSGEMSGTLEY